MLIHDGTCQAQTTLDEGDCTCAPRGCEFEFEFTPGLDGPGEEYLAVSCGREIAAEVTVDCGYGLETFRLCDGHIAQFQAAPPFGRVVRQVPVSTE